LLKKGFRHLASTQTMKNFFVIDALFMDEQVIKGREKEFVHLKELFSLGVDRLRSDPREYYDTIKGYLEGQSYEEFMATTTQIEWLYQKRSEDIISHLDAQQVKMDRLLP
jgi:NitT/TauT family transport system substrate-binding protein